MTEEEIKLLTEIRNALVYLVASKDAYYPGDLPWEKFREQQREFIQSVLDGDFY